jgi:DNA polymerase I-like protein with 3'-5' exonuclease and polymerase domains
MGWKPDEWNTKKENGKTVRTSPKLTESSFHTVKGEIPSLIARRAILVHRQRMLKNIRRDGEETGWLNQLRTDGRLEARAIPQGTPTGRFTHIGIVNVPNAHAVYGPEFRSLFIAPDGYSYVGCDAAQLEARIQAHYVFPYKGGQELADLLLNGDVHMENAKMWGLVDQHGEKIGRNLAKSPLYCLMYGGQPPKLAETMGCSLRDGERHYKAFWAKYSPLDEFKQAITQVWEARGGKKGGFLKGLDGRKLFARSPHALVNLMFQSGGSIAVKKATVLTDQWCEEAGLDSVQVLHFHDEFERETLNAHVDSVKEFAVRAFNQAGKYFKLNVPLVGDVKSGKSWFDVH